MSDVTQFRKVSLIALMIAFLGGSALMGCSSSDESSGSGSCAEQCASQPEGKQDECLLACEA